MFMLSFGTLVCNTTDEPVESLLRAGWPAACEASVSIHWDG